jgi:hypothetical protein
MDPQKLKELKDLKDKLFFGSLRYTVFTINLCIVLGALSLVGWMVMAVMKVKF